MSLQERVERLKEQVGHFANARLLTNELSKNSELRNEIRSLYALIYGRQLTGCINCITDAVFEILNKKNIMELKPKEYLLPAGALLHDVVNMDSAKAMSNANISEELALYHLATNPGCEARFIRLPEDWKQRVEAYKHRIRTSVQDSEVNTSEKVSQNSMPKPKAKRTKKSTEKTNQ